MNIETLKTVQRVNLNKYNPSKTEAIPLDALGNSTLTQPLYANSVSVIRYSIPNRETPIFTFFKDIYQMRLSYNGFTYTKYVDFIDLSGSGTEQSGDVYEISHLLSMLNLCIEECVSGLNLLVSLPNTEVPRFIYDLNTEHYKIEANLSAYKSTIPQPIKISVNDAMMEILQSLPVKYNVAPYSDTPYTFLFNQTLENTVGTHIVIEQESCTLGSYADPRQLLVITQLPIRAEIFAGSSDGSGQSIVNAMHSIIFNYSDGVKGFRNNLDFITTTNDYRPVSLSSTPIYDMTTRLYYITRDGRQRTFMIPPRTSVNILLEFQVKQ